MVQFPNELVELPGGFSVLRSKVIGMGPITTDAYRPDLFKVAVYTQGMPIIVEFSVPCIESDFKEQDTSKPRFKRVVEIRQQMYEKLFSY